MITSISLNGFEISCDVQCPGFWTVWNPDGISGSRRCSFEKHEIGFGAEQVGQANLRSWVSLCVACWDTFLELSSGPDPTQGPLLFEVVESAQQPGDSSPSGKWRTACFFLLQENE